MSRGVDRLLAGLRRARRKHIERLMQPHHGPCVPLTMGARGSSATTRTLDRLGAGRAEISRQPPKDDQF